MKILNFSDAHIRDTRPRRRKDDYLNTLIAKLNWIFDLADRERAVITCSGDLLDRPVVSELIKMWLIQRMPDRHIITVYGQHETRNRIFDDSCSLKLLDQIGVVRIVDRQPYSLSSHVQIYGCSWEEPIPEVVYPNNCNILLVHKLISDRDYWNGHVEYSDAKAFLKKYDQFDLVLSGDNHKSFAVHYEGRDLINCGSVMRSNIDQINHRPCCVIYDTDTRGYRNYFIPVAPIEVVMDLESAEEEKAVNEKLLQFTEELKKIHPYLSTSEDEHKFKKILMSRIKELPKGIQNMVHRAMEGNDG